MPHHVYQWHPIFVHFTVALLATSVVLYCIALPARKAAWRGRLLAGAELNLWIGAAITVVTVAFGWIAFQTVPHDEQAVHELMALHRNVALATLAGFAALAAVSIRHRRNVGYPSILFVIALLAALAGLAATGLLGGKLVFEHGLAVERPTEEPAGHHHEHPHS